MRPSKKMSANGNGHACHLAGVRRDEVLAWQSLRERLGWAERARAEAARRGLRFAVVAGRKYTTGAWVFDYIEAQAAAQEQAAAGGAESGNGNGQGGQGGEP